MSACKRAGCPNQAAKDYCSSACRAAAWRERHLPRCPHCGTPLLLTVTAEPEGTTPRQIRYQPRLNAVLGRSGRRRG